MKSTIMTRLAFAAVALLAAGCGAADDAAGPAANDAEPASTGIAEQALGPNNVYIEDIKLNGTGCPRPESVLTTIGEDKRSFIVTFLEMVLRHPPGPVLQRINCVASLRIHVPQGIQLTMTTINTRGFAHLPSRTVGAQDSTYFWAGGESKASHSPLLGPYDDLYNFTDNLLIGSRLTSPCGESRAFGINVGLTLNTFSNPTEPAFIDTETLDGALQKTVIFSPSRC